MNNEFNNNNEETTIEELLKQNSESSVDNTVLEMVDTTEEEKRLKEEKDNELIGKEDEVQLTRKDLTDDKYTPSHSMKNLKDLNESLDKELEEAKAWREKAEANDKQLEEMENIKKQKEEESKFNDNIVSEEDEETKEDEVQIDLSSITIKKVKDINKSFGEQMEKRKAKKYTTKVVLPNSGYTAEISGMSSPEIRNYSETINNLDLFGQMELRYKNLFSKIENTSIGDMDFETFLKRTALMEYETLTYGLFSSTFPEKSTYPFTCPKCKTKKEFTYYNKEYLDTAETDKEKREAILAPMRKVLMGQAIDAKEIFEEAATNKLIRKYLKHSKIIVELRHPTLHDQLYEVLGSNKDNLNDVNTSILNIMPFVKTVYLPTIETIDNEMPEYIPLDDIAMKIEAINGLNEKDDEELALAIQKNILDCYNLKYTIRAPKCSCGYSPEPEVVDFETMLFMTHQIRIMQN